MNIEISQFARRRHVPTNMYSHFDGSESDLIKLVQENFDNWKPGYRDGVRIVPVPPKGFYSATKTLQPGDKVQGEFVSRAPGEEPRLIFYIEGEKTPAKSVDIILYHRDVLAEKDEERTGADWDIVSINAYHDDCLDVPIEPQALIYNHFELSGGTATYLSDIKFANMLKASVLYWKDKIKVRPV